MEMAEDALSLMLYDMEEEGRAIPAATQLCDVETESPAFATYISADTFEYRKKFNNRAVKKMVLHHSQKPTKNQIESEGSARTKRNE